MNKGRITILLEKVKLSNPKTASQDRWANVDDLGR